jgi:hypothetical protein
MAYAVSSHNNLDSVAETFILYNTFPSPIDEDGADN